MLPMVIQPAMVTSYTLQSSPIRRASAQDETGQIIGYILRSYAGRTQLMPCAGWDPMCR